MWPFPNTGDLITVLCTFTVVVCAIEAVLKFFGWVLWQGADA